MMMKKKKKKKKKMEKREEMKWWGDEKHRKEERGKDKSIAACWRRRRKKEDACEWVREVNHKREWKRNPGRQLLVLVDVNLVLWYGLLPVPEMKEGARVGIDCHSFLSVESWFLILESWVFMLCSVYLMSASSHPGAPLQWRKSNCN